MGSVRSKITLTAVIVTAVALALAAAFLLRGLRGSLLAEIDDSVSDQAWDISVAVEDLATLNANPILNDQETLQVVFDDTGELYLANDIGVDGAEIVAELPFEQADFVDEPLVVDASIETATDTPGSEKMRAALAPVVLLDAADTDPLTYVLIGRSIGSVDSTVAATRTQLLIVFPLLTAFVGLLAWWLTGRALRPVELMRREVDDISAGDLSRRVSQPGSQDEIGSLAETMNGMLTRLEGSSTRQRQFVSDAAHELRTPLASIAAQLDVDATHPDTADLSQTAAAVRGEVGRMQHMIDSMLQLARSDQGRTLEVNRLVDLDELVRTSAQRVPKPEHITLDVTRVSPTEARGDEMALVRLFDNLIANAYRHASTRVDLGVGADESGVWVTVDDDGSGIAVAERDAVFERFVRLDEARTRDGGGSGLGLALCRDIAVQHGGNVFVVDSPIGGAEFVVRLPASGSTSLG